MSATPNLDRRLAVVFRDFDYEMQGNALISKGIRGYSADRIVGRFKSMLAAAEYLIPIIGDPEYSRRIRKAADPQEAENARRIIDAAQRC